VTLLDVENAQRADAASWALANGLLFAFDNDRAVDVHRQPTLVWLFRPSDRPRLTGETVLHSGDVEARIYVPAGTGAMDALELAEALQAHFRGKLYAGSPTLDEARIDLVGREEASYRVDVSIPWEFHERRVPQGVTSPWEQPGAVVAMQAVRELWHTHVTLALGLDSYFDNDPPEGVVLPFAWPRFRLLQPFAVDLSTVRVPGRLVAALHFPLGTGVAEHQPKVEAVAAAFDQRTHRGVVFQTPTVNRIGRTPFDSWQANVRLPFYYDVRT
jgi:hypothetical protein